jgi:hypothetical protein
MAVFEDDPAMRRPPGAVVRSPKHPQLYLASTTFSFVRFFLILSKAVRTVYIFYWNAHSAIRSSFVCLFCDFLLKSNF